MRSFTSCLLTLLLLAGCGGSTDTEPGREGGICLPDKSCDPGLACQEGYCLSLAKDCTLDDSQACTCPVEQQGSQLCRQDGTWGDCVCGQTCEFFRTGDAQCDSCIDEMCFGQCQACAQDEACVNLKECQQECSSSDCFQDCVQQYSDGMNLYLDLAGPAPSGCIGVNCMTACSP